MNNQELQAYNNNRNICQAGYASANVKETIRSMYNLLGIGPWEIVTLTDYNSSHVKIYNERINEPFFVYVAHCNVGKTDFEVLQPVYGPNAYSKFIEEKGAGLQHPKEKLLKEDLWDATLDAEKAGSELLLTGGIETDRFIYLDMQKMGGGIYELGNSPEDLVLEKECWPLTGDLEAMREKNRNRKITRIAYLAYDLRRVMRTLYYNLKMGPWSIAELNDKNTTEFSVCGKKVEGKFACQVATCMLGEMQIEIIQPVIGLEPMFDYLKKHGEGPYRVTEKMTESEMNQFIDHLKCKGYSPVISGTVNSEKFYSFNLEDVGLSVFEITTGSGYLSLEPFSPEVWPFEN